MTNYTQIPWTVKKCAGGGFEILGLNSPSLAVKPDLLAIVYDNANAKRIVHCVNTYDELLVSCLHLLNDLEAISQENNISMLTASNIHNAKIATLNAQGLKEEGYNA